MSDGYEPTQYDLPPVTPAGGQPAVGGPVPGGPVPPGGPGGPGDGLPPEEPDRRPWIIGGLVALIVVVAIILLLLSGDDGDDVATDASTSTTSSTSSTTSSTTTSTTTTTIAPTTTEAPTTTQAPTTTTEAPPATFLPPEECLANGRGEQTPGLAADTVYGAFLAGDEDCAAELMTGPARAFLFALEPQERSGPSCTETGTDEADCAFGPLEEGQSAVHLIMEFTGDQWLVTDVEETEG